MFGIGSTELLVIVLVAILVLGPEHLPRIMRTLQKVMSDFRRVSTEFQRAVNLENHQEEWQREQVDKTASGAKKKEKTLDPEVSPAQEATAQPTVTEESPPASVAGNSSDKDAVIGSSTHTPSSKDGSQ